ncbi:DUF5988 family protein [Streptomyces sp. NPDC027717]|uniref:DUF5988 family protein n=1 Tax=Streptomyces sp. NPDC027717 TaxID=3155765 RepID=UPI0033F65C82
MSLAETEPNLVVLLDGPTGIPRVYRCPGELMPGTDKIAVAHYGRHEHFERTDEVEDFRGSKLTIFRWSYSTKIAE